MNFKDEIYTYTECHFSFLDRLRIMVHGVASVRIASKTEHLPGEVLSESSVSVPRVFRLIKHTGGEEKSNKSVELDRAICGGKSLI